jgi:para-aminobenzoate synthetase component 1
MLPIHSEITYHDPLQTFALFALHQGAVFLDSATHASHTIKKNNRYSFIALDPFQTLRSKNNKIVINGMLHNGNPLTELEKQLAIYQLKKHPDLPPFQGGAAGYFGYELYQHFEKINLPAVDLMKFDDLVLGFYDVVIAYDHEVKRAWIFSSGFPELENEARHARALTRRDWLLRKLVDVSALPPLPHLKKSVPIDAYFSAANYRGAVQRVIDYILAGDIFEANISQRFSARLPAELPPFELYRRLRALNPAPFAAYLQFEDIVIASASPERFLQLLGRKVEARPIKGTIARGANAAEDNALAAQLLASEKDRAENVMIVDLLRNDLSRVCEDHSVIVNELCQLESYANVHHLVSSIAGQLQSEKSAVDLLRAAFPGGSITGAPKIRAMEIINEIEQAYRGPYCGSIGYIGFDGDMDSSIVIRSFAIKNNIATFQAGGAVVMDSDPHAEYKEVLTKSYTLRSALTSVPEYDLIN